MTPTPQRRTARPPHRGMTLIELTVAIAIVALLFGAVVTGLGALTGSKAKSAAGELAGTIRSLYDTAALRGKTCRLVFQLPEEKDGGRAKYWAECASGNVTAAANREQALQTANRDREERARRRGDARRDFGASRSSARFSSDTPSLQELMAREKERVESQATFAQYTASEIRPRDLPSGVQLSVWTAHLREPVERGLAFLYFFPQGFTEKAQVYVRQGNNVWTLVVSPLTGKAQVVADAVEVPR